MLHDRAHSGNGGHEFFSYFWGITCPLNPTIFPDFLNIKNNLNSF